MDEQRVREIKLSRLELEQMRDYAGHREHEGWYCGNRQQFEERHQRIKAWIKQEIEKEASERLRRKRDSLEQRIQQLEERK